jgi:hypothetical protein
MKLSANPMHADIIVHNVTYDLHESLFRQMVLTVLSLLGGNEIPLSFALVVL